MLAAGRRSRLWPRWAVSGVAPPGALLGSRRASSTASEAATAAALLEISGGLSKLKAAELNGIMRQCGLAQGSVKAHKVEALSAFVWTSQQLALRRYLSQHKRAPRKCSTAHGALVPEEVVSVDIGFRNLAFAHVSREGRVLAWQRVELLKEATFEPWALAAVVEAFVRDTLPVRPAAQCTYIIEHQRFRSQGSANVTNSVMVNNLIEALLYSCLRHVGAHIEAVNPTLVSIHWRLPDAWGLPDAAAAEDDAAPEVVEATPATKPKEPRGRPAAAKPRAAPRGAEKDRELAQAIVRMDQLLKEQKRATASQQDAIGLALGRPASRRRDTRAAAGRDADELQGKGSKQLGTLRDLRRRLIKKERSISLVQTWVMAFLAATAAPTSSGVAAATQLATERFPDSMWPFGARQHMVFAAGMSEMFYQEKKKDDLCDCIIQAAAWYRWQHSAAEVLDAHGSAQLIQAGRK
ncbi:hypothetical protein LPJ61_000471 [Coemansia biformis]|uniref:Mitochondrial resolvase Ydc2 catalytic domain-containing protein n=1 Tax=Coemansia biformis TaxID=1286918 RepID=A0A9W7YGP1_9FUNG|nr:hypothetical protein LPJ61_000471 [Coemansia biformis]